MSSSKRAGPRVRECSWAEVTQTKLQKTVNGGSAWLGNHRHIGKGGGGPRVVRLFVARAPSSRIFLVRKITKLKNSKIHEKEKWIAFAGSGNVSKMPKNRK
jgi:hypothetical protein